MTHTNFSSDEYSEGSASALRNEPFSGWTSLSWQAGWTDAKRAIVLKALGPTNYAKLDAIADLIAELAKLVRKVSTDPALGVDLALAVAHRALDGADISKDADPRDVRVDYFTRTSA